MQSDHSITQYIDGLKQGNEDAAQQIWQRFLERLIRLADQKLKSSPRKAVNEEDVVQQAFAEFFAQVQQGRFTRLNDRNDLWQILAMLVDRRAKDQIRRQNTQKAGGGHVHTESIFIVNTDANGDFGIAGMPDKMPTPEFAAEFTDQFRQLLGALDDSDLRQIALLKLQGHTNREIADKIGSSLRTVERRLEHIRAIWDISPNNEL